MYIVLCQWVTTTCHLNLYDTDRTFEHQSLQYNCLNYYVYREKIAYQELLDVTNEIIPYCFRPENMDDKLFIEVSVNVNSRNVSFEELRLENITSQQLLLWSIPIYIAEQYQLYLNEPTLSLNEYFYNCTEPWFGLKCQYSFEFNESMFFDKIVDNAFLTRKSYVESAEIAVQVPCYVLLNCHRYGQIWCLDWREVCNGNIDCFDDGADEEYCFDMEINECEDNEYRCQNGLCISEQLWEDGEGDVDCLDRSDEVDSVRYLDTCFRDPTFHCEEHACSSKLNLESFPCGDGRCVAKFDQCHNGRHELLINFMATKGHLTDECWIAMICKTKLSRQVNGTWCESLLINNSIDEFFQQCDSIIQFPTIPLYYGHVYFFYEKSRSQEDLDETFVPTYICYDQQLHDFIEPILAPEKLGCTDDHKQ
ncbi:unnamed protein product, partial [Rotaria magnacalcarata]